MSDPDFYSLSCGTTLVLPSIVAFLTIFLLVEVIEQPIRMVEIGGYWSCHGEQKCHGFVKVWLGLVLKLRPFSISNSPCSLRVKIEGNKDRHRRRGPRTQSETTDLILCF